jgi:hypothetical protein
MRRRKMHLVAFLLSGPTSHHHGMWRHPGADHRFLEPDYYEHVARVLEPGKFDALFFADVLALPSFYKGNFDTMLGLGGQMGLLDPLPLRHRFACDVTGWVGGDGFDLIREAVSTGAQPGHAGHTQQGPHRVERRHDVRQRRGAQFRRQGSSGSQHALRPGR